MLGTYPISELTLGTVALGMTYGISNAPGVPDPAAGAQVIHAALQAGITTLDTARSYGCAEQLIGSVIAGRPAAAPVVVTKFKLDASALANADLAQAAAIEQLTTSLRQLGIPRIPVCLFHMDRTMAPTAWQPVLHRVFEALKRAGLIAFAGVSIDHPDAVSTFADDPVLEVFQVPLNVMDLRLWKNGGLERLYRNGKFVFARSIYLQGLFFMEPDTLEGNLAQGRPFLRQLRELAAGEGLSVQELAFAFVHGMQAVGAIVFGAVSPVQVQQTVQLLAMPALGRHVITKIHRLFSQVPEQVITPGLWGSPIKK